MTTNTNQSGEKESNIVKFKKKQQLNIGIIIFGIIFIYLVATVVMYITAPHITIYEVRQGSILKDTAYTGLAIRNEIVVNATENGYINYYVQDGSKVKVGSNIYTLSNEELVFDDLTSEEELELTSEEELTIALDTLRSPGPVICPGNIVQREDFSVVSPVNHIFCGITAPVQHGVEIVFKIVFIVSCVEIKSITINHWSRICCVQGFHNWV